MTIPATEALQRLYEGNRRFILNLQGHAPLDYRQGFYQLAATQEPIAIILGCSDARVPAEIIFDQGLGDLFVIRVAGNIVAPSHIGNVEYAAESFGTGLVVVLGHTNCGAVRVTLEELQRPSECRSPNLSSIVNRIRPSVEPLLDAELEPDVLVQRAVRANIRASVESLRRGSDIIERLVTHDKLVVVGAEYSLQTGVVKMLDGAPGAA